MIIPSILSLPPMRILSISSIIHIALISNPPNAYGDTNFSEIKNISTTSFSEILDLDANDIDGDGDLDIVAGKQYELTWWENQGTYENSSWDKHVIDTDLKKSFVVHIADIDGNGKLDVIGGSSLSHIFAWWSNKNGDGTTWDEYLIDGGFGEATSVYTADIDSDNDLDVIGSSQFPDTAIKWWENSSSNGTTWTTHQIDGAISAPRDAYPVDLDKDGDIDIVGAVLTSGLVAWWENADGNGTAWNYHLIESGIAGPNSVHANDIDGDGDLDIVGALIYDDDIKWWENVSGNGTIWVSHIVEGNFDVSTSAYAVDLDGDNDIDLMGTARNENTIAWWENTEGNGETWTKHIIDSNYHYPSEVIARDVDGDSDLDILSSSGGGGSAGIAWWENILINNNQPPSLYPLSTQYADEGNTLTLTLAAVDPDGDDLTFSVLDPPEGATLSGTNFLWSIGFSDSGTHNITFTVQDSEGGTDSQVLTVIVANINRRPVLTLGDQSVNAETPLTVDLSLYASDPDGDPIVYTTSNNPLGSSITNNIFTWQPSAAQVGSHSATFSVSDGKGGTHSATITITVTAPNQPPAFSNIDNQTVQEGQQLSLELNATDPDGDALTYTLSGNPSGSSLSGATFNWTPSTSQSGSYTPTFTVSDGKGGSASKTITITVTNLNQPPSLASIAPLTVTEGNMLFITLSGSDPDGDALTYSMSNNPSGISLSGNISTWTPSSGQAGTYSISFTATDPSGATDSQTAIITVQQATAPTVNNAPSLVSIGAKSITEGNAISFALSGSDPDGDALTYSMSNNPSGSSLSGNTFSWTPSSGQTGTYSITFTATDPSGATASQTAIITVQQTIAANDAPSLASIGAKSATEGNAISFALVGSDPNGDALTYSMSNAPSGSSLSGNTFNWTPSSGQAGSYIVTFTVTDPSGASTSQTTTITATEAPTTPAPSNANPALSSIGNRTIDTGQQLIISLSGSDPDGDALTYSTSTTLAGSTLSGSTFTWSPTESQIGSYSTTFTVSDGKGGSDSKTITITVKKPTVYQAQLSVNALDFGDVILGQSKTLTLDITNTGDLRLSSFPFVIFGEQKARFSTAKTTSILPVNSTDQISVTFLPTAVGQANATLSIDYGTIFFEIPLTGNSALSPAALSLEKTSIDFGRNAFWADTTATLWIANTGQQDLLIEYAADTDFLALIPPALSISQGDTGRVSIAYRRTMPGHMDTTLTLLSNDPEQEEIAIAISGYTTHPPRLRQTPADTLDFGDVSVGETLTKNVRLANGGEEDISDTLSIAGAAFSTSSPPIWSASGLTFSDYALDFSPNHLGEFVGELNHRSNSFTAPQQTLVLKGRGLHGFRPRRTHIALDTLFTGQSTTDTLFFTNHTSKKLSHSFELPRTNFLRIDTTGTTGSLPGQQLKIPITFTGNRPGAFSFETTVNYSSAGDLPRSYKQLYSGYIRPSPQLAIHPDTLDLGAVRIGQTSPTHDLLLENTGAATLRITQIAYFRNEYRVANEDSLPFVLQPGQSRPLRIAAALKKEGLSERLLIVRSNDPLHERSEVLLRADGRDSTFFRTPIRADFAFDLDSRPGQQDSTEAVVQTGDQLTLSLYTSAVEDLVGFNARVHYDTSQVELLQVSEKLDNEGNILHQSTGTALFLPIANESAGQSTYGGVLLSPGPNNSVHRGGLLAAWKFKIKEGFAESGTIRLGQVALRSVAGQDTLTQELAVQLRLANVGFSPISMDLDPTAGNQEVDQLDVGAAEKLTLQFHLDGLSQISGYGLRLQYDPAAISLDLSRFQIDTQGRVAFPVTRQLDDNTAEIGAVAFSQAGLNPSFLGSLPIALKADFIGETTIRLSRITLNFPNRPDQSITVSKEVVIRTRKTDLPSDFNGDGVVNIADFFLFTDALGQSNPDPRFDLNEDGQLDFGDFFIFIDQFSPQQRAKLVSLANVLPRETALHPNYPNPFNAQTIMRFSLPQSAYIELALYDIQGQLVRQFIAEHYPAGLSEITWDGLDAQGHRLASGVYILSLRTPQRHFARKMLLLR